MYMRTFRSMCVIYVCKYIHVDNVVSTYVCKIDRRADADTMKSVQFSTLQSREDEAATTLSLGTRYQELTRRQELIWFGTPQQLQKLDFLLFNDRFPQFVFSTSVRDPGVILDITVLTFSEHISNQTRSSYYQLRPLRTIRKSVSTPTMTTIIVHAFVSSRIDYCNSLHIGLPKVRRSPSQSVLNAAARLIALLPKSSSHISSFMINQLHWLPLSGSYLV